MKVLLISPCMLPVPAVKGGAVLTLIESLIKENEKKQKIDLTVIGSFDKEAKEKSCVYRNTKFIFIKENKICKLLDDAYEFIYAKIVKKPHRVLKRYIWKIVIINRIKRIMRKRAI